MAEYKSNSFKSKEEAKRQEAAKEQKFKKVVSGNTRTRENKGRKFTDIFISEDASNVKSYVVMDVIVPAFKKLIYDIFTDGIDIILYGGGGRGGSRSRDSRVSYYHGGSHGDRRGGIDRFSAKNRFDYADIEYESRADAQYVLDQMRGAIKTYGIISIADQYDMSGLTAPYTSDRYGWTNIDDAYVDRSRGSYIIKLPKAMPID